MFIELACVPHLQFIMSLTEIQRMPDASRLIECFCIEDYSILWDAGVDERYVLSEIIRHHASVNVFGKMAERSTDAAKYIIWALKEHVVNAPEAAAWCDEYIAAAKQARNRQTAHQLLEGFE